MSDVRRCAACRKEKPVSEMKTCMHGEMHSYVCDSKCMHDFYNPPKAEKTGHAAIIAALQSTLSAAETERDQLRAELDAIRGQSHVVAHRMINELGVAVTLWQDGPPPSRIVSDRGVEQVDVTAELAYALPPQQPDAVSVPSDTALRRAAKFLSRIDNGCNEVKTLLALVANAQEDAVSVPRKLLERLFSAFDRSDANPDLAMDELRALLSTRQAEEGE